MAVRARIDAGPDGPLVVFVVDGEQA